MRAWRVTAALAALLIVSPGSDRLHGQTAGKLMVTSTAFKHNETIPADYTGAGKNVSPPLNWTGAPAGTREFALIMDDPDAPMPQPFVHWVIYKIPGTASGLPEAVPMGPTVKVGAAAGALQGPTGFAMFASRRGGQPVDPGYRGPMPPPGKPHRYFFKVYALNAPLDAKEGMTKDDLLKAMEGKIAAQGELIGLFERK
jgi:Raf kinase inhibitor-like YbhB/YbcL family protein